MRLDEAIEQSKAKHPKLEEVLAGLVTSLGADCEVDGIDINHGDGS